MKRSDLLHFPFQKGNYPALVSGILLILSFPNPLSVAAPHFPFGPLAWIALVPLLLSLEGKDSLQGLGLGWMTGFIAFTGTLYWVVVAMHHYGGIPVFVSLIILLVLSLYLGLYLGAFGAVLCLVRRRTRWSLLVVAPPLWVALEYLRSVLLTGFPWENLGYSQYMALPIIQIADVTGVYGVSFAILLVNCLVAMAVARMKEGGRAPLGIFLFLALFLGTVLLYGSIRIGQEEQRLRDKRSIKIGIAQGNIDQSLKWDTAYQEATIGIYRTLTQKLAQDDPDLVIWPETAVPFFFPLDQAFSRALRGIPRETGAFLLFGSPFYQEDKGRTRYLNSAFLLSPDGEIRGRYDKIHLVPFGEYVPLSRFLPFIRPLVESVASLTSGNETVGAVVFSTPKGRFGILICYEIIFPELSRRFIRKGADFLITITNDAWFGKTSAPFQHFSMATFRAVENRSFVVRAANTGISGIIDSTGRIVLETEIFSRQAEKGEVFLRGRETLYTRHGDLFAYACLAWSLLFIIGACLAASKERNRDYR